MKIVRSFQERSVYIINNNNKSGYCPGESVELKRARQVRTKECGAYGGFCRTPAGGRTCFIILVVIFSSASIHLEHGPRRPTKNPTTMTRVRPFTPDYHTHLARRRSLLLSSLNIISSSLLYVCRVPRSRLELHDAQLPEGIPGI